MIAPGGTVGLAEEIIDDTCIVQSYFGEDGFLFFLEQYNNGGWMDEEV